MSENNGRGRFHAPTILGMFCAAVVTAALFISPLIAAVMRG